jgi:hypothetical protein
LCDGAGLSGSAIIAEADDSSFERFFEHRTANRFWGGSVPGAARLMSCAGRFQSDGLTLLQVVSRRF